MKGEIFACKHFAVHDGPGIRTTLFMKGCSLNCRWCHNPEGKKGHPQLAYYPDLCIHCGACSKACAQGAHSMQDGKHVFDRQKCSACGRCEKACVKEALSFYGKTVEPQEILPELLADRMFYRTTGGVTLSGGECLCQDDFCAELLQLLKKENIHTAVDTCGHVLWKAFEKVLPYTDCFLYDVKAAQREVHKALCGAENHLILENLKKLDERGAMIEVRIPYVPHYNDQEMAAIAELLRPLKAVKSVKVLGYHSYASSKYEALGLENPMPETPMPSAAQVKKMQDMMEESISSH